MYIAELRRFAQRTDYDGVLTESGSQLHGFFRLDSHNEKTDLWWPAWPIRNTMTFAPAKSQCFYGRNQFGMSFPVFRKG